MVPRDELRFQQTRADGSEVVLMDDRHIGWQLRAPVFSARLGLTGRRADWPVALKLSLSLPELESTNRVVESRGHDIGLALSTAGRLARGLSTTASLAVLRSRSGRFRGDFELARHMGSLMLSVDYALPGVALVAQLLVESGTTEDSGTDMDDPSTQVLLGTKVRVDTGTVLELALIENLFIHDNTVDYGLHAGISTWLR